MARHEIGWRPEAADHTALELAAASWQQQQRQQRQQHQQEQQQQQQRQHQHQQEQQQQQLLQQEQEVQRCDVDLLARKSDVYALAVHALARRRLRVVVPTCAAMLLTGFVQCALLGLLLHAARSSHSTAIRASSSDLQDAQLRVLQLQLCSLHETVSKQTAAATGKGLGYCDCLLAAFRGQPGGPNCSENLPWLDTAVKWAYNRGSALPFDAGDVVGVRRLPGAGAAPTALYLCMLLSLVCLMAFLACEVVHAMQLGYAVRAYGGLLGPSHCQPRYRHCGCYVRSFPSRWRFACACVVPFLQAGVAVLAMWTAGLMLTSEQSLTDWIQFVLNSVALAFIVQVDDTVGSIVAWAIEWLVSPDSCHSFEELHCTLIPIVSASATLLQRVLHHVQSVLVVGAIALMLISAAVTLSDSWRAVDHFKGNNWVYWGSWAIFIGPFLFIAPLLFM